ncbi:hypothetical protein [Microseira wollei]|uniref:Uncharacterized protein n=1 Tax=Microseira wollei NIES-4236 TaxID=2530354 RepID=A0AAV3XII1_9CYAN|nr:hypothetical protein [Microseira wollei]GET40785.1 hypothetical protein MiSe_55970 [Microseira wollei NIES-4236]
MKNQYDFCDEYTLAETAENLAKKAVKLGFIQSFVVRVFADSWQFYIPKENESEPLTPEQAYLYLKRLVEQASQEAKVGANSKN